MTKVMRRFLFVFLLLPAAVFAGPAFVIGYSSYAPQRQLIRDSSGYIYSYASTPLGITIARLDPLGTQTLFQTTLGSSGDSITAVTVDSSGNFYIAGFSPFGAYPATTGAFQGPHTANQPLVFLTKYDMIGGKLIYTATFGGPPNPRSSATGVQAIAVDSSGNMVIAGTAGGVAWPTTTGVLQSTAATNADGPGFVTKLNAAGSALLFSTYIGNDPSGSSKASIVKAIALDPNGAIFLIGTPGSTSFPISANAYQTTFGSSGGCFAAKMTGDGASLVYSTYLSTHSPSQGTGCAAIATDGQGNLIIVGTTTDPTFPTTPGAFQTQFQGQPCHFSVSGCLFHPNSSNLFVTKMNATGTALVASTFLGGDGGAAGNDLHSSMALDPSGNIYLAGTTGSSNFPMMNPLSSGYNCPECFSIYQPIDMFVSILDPTLATLEFSTYLGGPNGESVQSMSLDSTGGIWVNGTSQGDFPVTANAAQPGPVLPNFQGGLPTTFGVIFHLIPATAPTAPPTITSITPPVIGPLSGIPSVTLQGTNFTTNSVVFVNGTAHATTFVNATQLNVAVSPNDFPAAVAGVFADVRQITPAGSMAATSISAAIQIPAPSNVGQIDIDVHDITGAAVAGAKVTLGGATYGVGASSLNVRFNPGFAIANTLTVTAPGYQTANLSVGVFDGQETSVSVTLVPTGVGQTYTFQAGLQLDTGIDLSAGQTVIVYAQGSWNGYGPDGELGCSASLSSKLPNGGTCYALAAEIGNAPWFTVGAAFAGPVANSGRLFLGVNDNAGAIGSPFTVTVIVLNNAICTPQPSINMSLAPGFYITEVRNAPGTPAGYWAVGVSTNQASGGFNFGGDLQENLGNPSYGAVYLGAADTVHVQAASQDLSGTFDTVPGYPPIGLVVTVLDGNHNPVGSAQTGLNSVAFDVKLNSGFYIFQAQAAQGTQRATFQMELNNTNGFSGGVNAGGFLAPGSVGFAAFYIPATQQTSIVTYALPTFSNVGASCLTLRLLDANRNVIRTAP